MVKNIFLYFVAPSGAFIRWLFKGFKGTFDDHYNEKQLSQNMWVGIVTYFILINTIAIFKTFIINK